MKKINPITVFMALAVQAIVVIYLALFITNTGVESIASSTILIQNDKWASENLTVASADLNSPNSILNLEDLNEQLVKPYGIAENTLDQTYDLGSLKPVDTRERIRLTYDSPLGYHREILVGLDHRATNSFDIGFDAPLIENNREDMYWIIDETKCVIQGVSHFEGNQSLRLGVKVSESGHVRIRVNSIENMDEAPEIFLKDMETGKVHPIIDDAFELDLEPGIYDDRFKVVFDAGLLTIDDITLAEGFSTYMNNEHSELRIKKILDSEVLGVDLYNYLGQRVGTWRSELTGRDLSIPVRASAGMYVVNVTTEHGILNKKILIK